MFCFSIKKHISWDKICDFTGPTSSISQVTFVANLLCMRSAVYNSYSPYQIMLDVGICPTLCVYLVCFTCNQVADGLAEERGQQGIKGRLLLQKVVELLQKGFISTQLIINKSHI